MALQNTKIIQDIVNPDRLQLYTMKDTGEVYAKALTPEEYSQLKSLGLQEERVNNTWYPGSQNVQTLNSLDDLKLMDPTFANTNFASLPTTGATFITPEQAAQYKSTSYGGATGLNAALSAAGKPLTTGSPEFNTASQGVAGQPAQTVSTNQPTNQTQPQTYQVQPGDTLSAIASRYGVPISSITGYRSGNPNLIYPGETLNIGGQSATGQPGASGANLDAIQQQLNQIGGQIPDIQQGIIEMKADGTPVATTEQKSTLANILAQNYGIDISKLEEAFTTQPTKTFEEIYQTTYNSLGLVNTKSQIDTITSEINKADADYNKAVGDINENPWISEAGRVGKIEKLNQNYELTRKRLDGQLTLLQNTLDRGIEQAKEVATQTLNTFDKQRSYAKEELDYYISRAQADLDAQASALVDEEKYRYSNIKEVNGGLYDLDSKKWIVAPKTTPTSSTTNMTDEEKAFNKVLEGYRDKLASGDIGWGEAYNFFANRYSSTNPELTRRLSTEEILAAGGDPSIDETYLDILLNKKLYYNL